VLLQTDFRFAFLDFLSPEQATAALLNRGNKYYTNRKLILQVSPPNFPLLDHILTNSTLRKELQNDQEQDEL